MLYSTEGGLALMTENKTEKSRWSVPLRVLAVVLAVALLFSLLMPAVTGLLSQTAGEEQGFAG